MLDTAEKDRTLGKEVTIHQYIQSRKRRKARTVTHVIGENWSLKTGQEDITRSFTDYITRKHEHIPIDERSLGRTMSCGIHTVPVPANAALEEPITILDEKVRAT